jgi:SAM-dependent methyltransferase
MELAEDRAGVMKNPWLDIPLDEYEGHMALPQVAQARLLADIFKSLLERHRPRSVAVLGCAGGNGFEWISANVTERVVGVDINPEYIERLRARFQDRIPALELFVGDIQSGEVAFCPVELVFAGLVLEYVDVEAVLQKVRPLLIAGGVLGTVVQLSDSASAAITPSPFPSLQALAAIMRLVPPLRLTDLAGRHGYREVESRAQESPGGKRFQVQTFRAEAPIQNGVGYRAS